MNFRKHTTIMAVGLLLMAGMFFTGCGNKPPAASPEEKISRVGVVDQEKVRAGHPLWPKVEMLQKELGNLERTREMALRRQATNPAPVLPENRMPGMTDMTDEGLFHQANQEFVMKMKEKEKSLNQQLQQEERQLKEQLAPQYAAYAEKLEEEYLLPLCNLQLRLQVLDITPEAAQAMQKEMARLHNEREKKLQAYEQVLVAELEKKMAPMQKEAEQELQKYADELQQEIMERQKQARSKMAIVPSESFRAQNLAELQLWERQMEEKQQQQDRLLEKIQSDIREQVIRLAAEKGLDWVMTGKLVNVRAVDLTEEILKAWK